MPEAFEQSTTTSPRKLFKNPNEFSLWVEQQSVETGTNCYTILIDFCEENDIDPEEIANLVNRQLKEKLYQEFVDLGVLRKKASLYD